MLLVLCLFIVLWGLDEKAEARALPDSKMLSAAAGELKKSIFTPFVGSSRPLISTGSGMGSGIDRAGSIASTLVAFLDLRLHD